MQIDRVPSGAAGHFGRLQPLQPQPSMAWLAAPGQEKRMMARTVPELLNDSPSSTPLPGPVEVLPITEFRSVGRGAPHEHD